VEQPEEEPRPGPGDDSFDRALADLTAGQRAAVLSPSGGLCIVAGAGSGKTRVLTLRVARRIRDGSAEADHTAVCTFTRKAAHELRHRLRRYGVAVSTPATAAGVPTPGVRAGTLHQLALTMLRRHALDSGAPAPAVAEHRFRILQGLVTDPTAAALVDAEIGWAKSRCLTPETYAEHAGQAARALAMPFDQVAEAFASYELALRRRQSLDLDDVLIRSADLLLDDASFAEGVRWRYRHLSVDEFQDVNPAQYRLVRALTGDRDDLCVVGDPNQAIYGWNGADPSLLTDLPELVAGMQVIRLDENHRSTPQVVAAAVAALGPAAVTPPRSAVPDGPLPVVTTYDDDATEAEGVVAHLIEWSDDGRPWSDQAVLARTHDQLAVVGRALARAGIPYRIAPGAEASEGGRRPVTGSGTIGVGVAARTSPRRSRPARGAAPDGAEEAVELATFHRSKGLEWGAVCVVGLEDGFVPIVYATSTPARDEERRLLYVALTRASDHLHCSWARSRRMGAGRQVDRQPSPWLAAVARVSRTGSGRLTKKEAGDRFAAMRTALGTARGPS
jgi:DNA helicase-2/ATP-dependent DNA helicase PcrA